MFKTTSNNILYHVNSFGFDLFCGLDVLRILTSSSAIDNIFYSHDVSIHYFITATFPYFLDTVFLWNFHSADSDSASSSESESNAVKASVPDIAAEVHMLMS